MSNFTHDPFSSLRTFYRYVQVSNRLIHIFALIAPNYLGPSLHFPRDNRPIHTVPSFYENMPTLFSSTEILNDRVYALDLSNWTVIEVSFEVDLISRICYKFPQTLYSHSIQIRRSRHSVVQHSRKINRLIFRLPFSFFYFIHSLSRVIIECTIFINISSLQFIHSLELS